MVSDAISSSIRTLLGPGTKFKSFIDEDGSGERKEVARMKGRADGWKDRRECWSICGLSSIRTLLEALSSKASDGSGLRRDGEGV